MKPIFLWEESTNKIYNMSEAKSSMEKKQQGRGWQEVGYGSSYSSKAWLGKSSKIWRSKAENYPVIREVFPVRTANAKTLMWDHTWLFEVQEGGQPGWNEQQGKVIKDEVKEVQELWLLLWDRQAMEGDMI